MWTVEIFVQSIDQIHILLFDCEIKNIAVTSDAVRMYGFRDYWYSLLGSPAQTNLSRSMGIFSSEYTHNIIIKICTPCKRGICLYLDSFILAIINQLFRIAERMAFNLIYSRYDSGIGFQFFQMTDFKIADTDRKEPAQISGFPPVLSRCWDNIPEPASGSDTNPHNPVWAGPGFFQKHPECLPDAVRYSILL